jgi:hypothetical protein
MLANPSFELPGSGGATFAGWSQFGSTGSTTPAPHGAVAARVSGPNTGNWDVSGYWQKVAAAPGQKWIATVHAWHSPTRPLAGGSKAILNIEWRDASQNLISYESHTVADASTPAGQVVSDSVVSAAAPVGTASARLLLGVLQGPTDPVADVYFDEATFYNAGPPTLDSRQWTDFPGGRTLAFAGRTWRVKGPGYYGPGPNNFCDTGSCTWVDAAGDLHLTIQKISNTWYSTEVTLTDNLGYGDYRVSTRGRLDTLHPNVVLGIFLWQYQPCYDASYGWWNPYNEIDIEYSRWGNPANAVGQFVAQPYDYPGNIDRYAATFSAGEITTHAMRWLSDRVEYRAWRGGPQDESPATLIHAWTYTGPHLPRPEQPRLHLNLWQFSAPPDVNQEVVVDTFVFVGACPGPNCAVDVPAEGAPAGEAGRRTLAAPNPFRGGTSIRFTVPRAGAVELAVYDVAGRRVRTLLRGAQPAGDGAVTWDGRDDAGREMPPGVYLYRYAAPAAARESGRLILLP